VARRLVRDESGMTMGLAVIMIVLIGVMGAGLLTFVRSDLNSVIEENKGQKALDIADAGVQAAKAHLRVDPFRQHYDTDVTNDCTIIWNANNTEVLEPGGPRVGGDNWSKSTDIYDPDENGYCEGEVTSRDNDGDPNTDPNPDTPWPEQFGVTKCFPDSTCETGGRFHVTIECFDQAGDDGDEALIPDPCVTEAGTAPEDLPANGQNGTKFFKITSTGYDTTTGDGAIRKIEAIYTTSKRTYSPIAYWTPRNILFIGNALTVKRMSFFAGRKIGGVRGSGPGSTIADPRPGPEAIYRDWNAPPYNTTPRKDASGNPVIDAGFGAIQFVCGPQYTEINIGNCTVGTRLPPNGYNDYDSLTNPRFVESPNSPQPTNQITFPFDPGGSILNPRSLIDPGLLEEMRAAASEQGNYCQVGGGSNPWQFGSNCSIDDWTDEGAIYFIDGAGSTIEYNIAKNYPLTARGIIVVNDGNFELNSQSQGFQGVIIVVGDGGNAQTGAGGTGHYEQRGVAKLDGYVTASSNITIRGEVDPDLTTEEIVDLNTFVDVKLWSWRECYINNATCNF
jgi:hypothetical protein